MVYRNTGMVLFAFAAACHPALVVRDRPAPAPPSSATTAAAPTAASTPSAAPAEDECADGAACTARALQLVRDGRTAEATPLLKRACGPGGGIIDACAQQAVLLVAGGTAPREQIAKLARIGCSVDGGGESNRAIRGEACFIVALALRDHVSLGTSFPYQPLSFAKDACKLGYERACSVVHAATAAQDEATGVPNANIRVGNISSDGVKLEQVACHTGEVKGMGGMLGAMLVGQGFVARRAKLNACDAGATRVRWVGAGGIMTKVEVISPPEKGDACVVRALKGAPSPVSGLCAATFRR